MTLNANNNIWNVHFLGRLNGFVRIKQHSNWINAYADLAYQLPKTFPAFQSGGIIFAFKQIREYTLCLLDRWHQVNIWCRGLIHLDSLTEIMV